MKYVKVDWADSCATNGWHCTGYVYTPSKCTTVGILIKSNRTCMSVALSTSDSPSISDVVTIPRCCIKKITYLEEINNAERG